MMTDLTNNAMGKIIVIRGVVVDVMFENSIPKVYDALKVKSSNVNGKNIVIEVLQLLENGVVRGIAVDSTDGLKRGDEVENT